MGTERTLVNVVHACSVKSTSDTALSLLDFRLHKDHEGLWVQCDACDAWRYVASAKDPLQFSDVPFFCADVKKHCGSQSDPGYDGLFFHPEFFPGNVVWAHKEKDPLGVSGSLWWPALIEDAHDRRSQFFLLGANRDPESRPIAYHVTFLDTWRSGGWVANNKVVPFVGDTAEILRFQQQKTVVDVPKRARLLAEAVERARNALNVTDITRRLELFSFVAHVARQRGMLKLTDKADNIANGVEGNVSNKSTNIRSPLKRPHGKQAKKAATKKRQRRAEPTKTTSVINSSNTSVILQDVLQVRGVSRASPVQTAESIAKTQQELPAKDTENMEMISSELITCESVTAEPREIEEPPFKETEPEETLYSGVSPSVDQEEPPEVLEQPSTAEERENDNSQSTAVSTEPQQICPVTTQKSKTPFSQMAKTVYLGVVTGSSGKSLNMKSSQHRSNQTVVLGGGAVDRSLQMKTLSSAREAVTISEAQWQQGPTRSPHDPRRSPSPYTIDWLEVKHSHLLADSDCDSGILDGSERSDEGSPTFYGGQSQQHLNLSPPVTYIDQRLNVTMSRTPPFTGKVGGRAKTTFSAPIRKPFKPSSQEALQGLSQANASRQPLSTQNCWTSSPMFSPYERHSQ